MKVAHKLWAIFFFVRPVCQLPECELSECESSECELWCELSECELSSTIECIVYLYAPCATANYHPASTISIS